MIITKYELKILKFVYAKKTISYKALSKKFSKYSNLQDTLESLTYHHYLVQVGGHQNNMGEPIPITDKTLFTMDSLGSSEVESKQWFNLQYVLTALILPIIVGVASSAITALILALLA